MRSNKKYFLKYKSYYRQLFKHVLKTNYYYFNIFTNTVTFQFPGFQTAVQQLKYNTYKQTIYKKNISINV